MDSRAAALVLALVLVSAPGAVTADPATAEASAVRIDAAKTGTPISPFVYGQFIEHLGRCIYGGLWAEMLEDRKFFYPVTGDAPAWEMFTPGPSSYEGAGHPYELLVRSPWMVIGERSAVTTVKEGALAGEHSVQVALDTEAAPRHRAGEARAAGRARVRGPHRPRRRRPREGLARLGRRRDDAPDGQRRRDREGVDDPPAALPRGRDDRQRPARDRRAGRRDAPDRRRLADARRQRPRLAARHGGAPARARLARLPLAGRQLRLAATTGGTASAIPTAGRRGRTRRGRASRRTTSGSTSSWTSWA